MRVIAGSARSLPLKTPAGMETRPTTDRIKETLFNILQNDVPGAVFIDCFAGSGGIGIEALSRGAKKAVFIDNSPVAVGVINENLKFTKFTENSTVLKTDVITGLMSVSEKHADIIFMDPPYNHEYEKNVLAVMGSLKFVDPDTLIIVEADLNTDFSYASDMKLDIVREKRYKTNKHVFLRAKAL